MKSSKPSRLGKLVAVLFMLAIMGLLVLLHRRGDESQIAAAMTPAQPTEDSPPPSSIDDQRPVTWGEFVNYKQKKRQSFGPSSSAFAPYAHKGPKPIVCVRAAAVRGSNATDQCDVAWGNAFVDMWKARRVDELCELNAASRIECIDSPLSATRPEASRFCVFDNAMMNFKKTRIKTRSDGVTKSRVFERGFLSAQCGETGKDNIGLPLYTPDIEDHHDATCSLTFNETVLAYSHLDSRSLHKTTQDYLNVVLMLRLAGLQSIDASKKVSFLNIDSIRKGGHFSADQPSANFVFYEKTFHRVIKASDLGANSKVCFKRLIMPPRPVINFMATEQACSMRGPSSLFQQLNFHMRQAGGALPAVPTTPAQGLRIVALEHMSMPATFLSSLRQHLLGDNVEIVTVNRSTMPHPELTALVQSASILLGSTNDDLATMFHLPLGTPSCCGVVQMTPPGPTRGDYPWGNTARFLGFRYVSANEGGPLAMSVVVRKMLATMSKKPSCLTI